MPTKLNNAENTSLGPAKNNFLTLPEIRLPELFRCLFLIILLKMAQAPAPNRVNTLPKDYRIFFRGTIASNKSSRLVDQG
jgi:hypothetical protein